MNRKNLRVTLCTIIASAILVAIVVTFILIGDRSSSSSDSSSFPFFVFFPGWIAIFIPIITQKRREQRKRMYEEVINNEKEF